MVAAAIVLAVPLVLAGPLGTLQGQSGLNWSWTSGRIFLGIGSASHVGAEVHNASSSPQQIRVVFRQAEPPFDVVFSSATTVQPGASTGGAVACVAVDPPCGLAVELRVLASSPQVAPSGWVDPSAGSDPEAIEHLFAGDFMLVTPRQGVAATAVGADRRAAALQRRVNRSHRQVIRRLKRIERALR